MADPTDAEMAARARAAMSFAGKTYEQLAAESGVTYDVLRAGMGKTNPKGLDMGRLYKIADACGLPRRFMDEGFGPLLADGNADLHQAVSLLQRQHRDLSREMVALAQAVAQTQKQDAGTDSPEVADPDAVGEGGEE